MKELYSITSKGLKITIEKNNDKIHYTQLLEILYKLKDMILNGEVWHE